MDGTGNQGTKKERLLENVRDHMNVHYIHTDNVA